MNIDEFKANNDVAQQLNAEIQRAHGALEENKRQFDKLCAEYNEAYHCNITAETLEAELASVMQTVQAQATAQAAAIERAKQGIVISDAPVSGTTSPDVAPAQVQTAVPPVNMSAVPASAGAPMPNMVNPAVAVNTATPAVSEAETPAVSEAEAPAPRPVSAASLSAQAFSQAMSSANMTDPTSREVAKTPDAEKITGSGILGWNNSTRNVDFSAMLGGKFGG